MGKTQAVRDGLGPFQRLVRRTRQRLNPVSTAVGTGVDAVLSIALGASCAACGELLERPTLGPVCGTCWRSIAALPLPASQVSSVIERAQAIGPHDAALREIVHALKYDGRRSLAGPLAALMRQRCQWALDGAEVAVPVPLHPSRHRERGFNQALDLSRALGLPIARALRRLRPTPSQTGLSGNDRRENMRGAFAPSRLPWRRRAVERRIVVLVDDVSTTGATLDECARVLSAMGAREVRAVTAARAALSARIADTS